MCLDMLTQPMELSVNQWLVPSALYIGYQQQAQYNVLAAFHGNQIKPGAADVEVYPSLLWTRDIQYMTNAMYEHHGCTPLLTNQEQPSVATLSKRVSPDKGVFNFVQGEQVTVNHISCYHCYIISY